MKKLAILGLIISVSGLTGQSVFAQIPAADPAVQKQQLQESHVSWLGVMIENISPVLGSHLSPYLKENQGVIVRNISPDSPAFKADLKPYDVIAKFNDQEIFTIKQLTLLVRATQPETTVSLSIIRHGKLMTQDVILEPSPDRMGSRGHHMPHGYFPPFPLHHGKDMHSMPPYWNNSFPNQIPGPNQMMPPPMSQQNRTQQNSWSEFESISIESTGNNQHRAVVKHKGKDGNSKEFVFEGSREDIQEQILKLEDMEQGTKKSLLQALDMNNRMPQPPFGRYPFMTPPDRFNHLFPGNPGFPSQRW